MDAPLRTIDLHGSGQGDAGFVAVADGGLTRERVGLAGDRQLAVDMQPTIVSADTSVAMKVMWQLVVASKKSVERRCLSRLALPVSTEATSMTIRPASAPPPSSVPSPCTWVKRPFT